MMEIKFGLDPVYNSNSRILILGSFPSIKSRAYGFYYGNKQNRFWKLLSEFYNETIPEDLEGRKNFVLSKGIALWDVVSSCEIVGSQDNSITNYRISDISSVLNIAPIELILINGSKAYQLFEENIKECRVPYVKMSSTSPANPRFNKEEWFSVLSRIIK